MKNTLWEEKVFDEKYEKKVKQIDNQIDAIKKQIVHLKNQNVKNTLQIYSIKRD